MNKLGLFLKKRRRGISIVVLVAGIGIIAYCYITNANTLEELPTSCSNAIMGCNECGRRAPGDPRECTKIGCIPDPIKCTNYFKHSIKMKDALCDRIEKALQILRNGQ